MNSLLQSFFQDEHIADRVNCSLRHLEAVSSPDAALCRERFTELSDIERSVTSPYELYRFALSDETDRGRYFLPQWSKALLTAYKNDQSRRLIDIIKGRMS